MRCDVMQIRVIERAHWDEAIDLLERPGKINHAEIPDRSVRTIDETARYPVVRRLDRTVWCRIPINSSGRDADGPRRSGKFLTP